MKRSRMLAAILVSLAVLTAASSASAMYHPTVGKWVVRDPIGYAYAEVHSLYAYVGSAPSNGIDPGGLTNQRLPTLPVPDVTKSAGWQSFPPLQDRCPPGAACSKLTLSFFWAREPGWGDVLEHLGGAGSIRGATTIEEILYNLDKGVGYCECVEKLTLFYHASGHGGFRAGERTGEVEAPDHVTTDLRADGTHDDSTAGAFGKAIKGVMCKPKCTINVMSCGGAGEALSVIARETGCAVTGATDLISSWSGWWFWPSFWRIGNDRGETGNTITYYPSGQKSPLGPSSGRTVFRPVPMEPQGDLPGDGIFLPPPGMPM